MSDHDQTPLDQADKADGATPALIPPILYQGNTPGAFWTGQLPELLAWLGAQGWRVHGPISALHLALIRIDAMTFIALMKDGRVEILGAAPAAFDALAPLLRPGRAERRAA